MSGLYSRYSAFLPPLPQAVDLGQGGTPLVKSRSLGPRYGIKDLRFKLESLNPSGSYKDRYAGLALGLALASGQDRVVATSSGNTGAALAAFAAASGLKCALYVSENAPQGKLEQMLAYGAEVYRVAQFTIDAAESARIADALAEACDARGLPLNTTAYAKCPLPMEGIKTIAYELNEALGAAIGNVFIPAGGGGLFLAIARGFDDMGSAPRLNPVQPEGNDTIITPLREGAAEARSVQTSTSISGLGVGYVLDGHEVLAKARSSGGQGQLLNEDKIREVQALLAREEGILVEPAGAVSVAGALQAAERGELADEGATICILTGHAFKDPSTLRSMGGASHFITRAEISSTF